MAICRRKYAATISQKKTTLCRCRLAYRAAPFGLSCHSSSGSHVIRMLISFTSDQRKLDLTQEISSGIIQNCKHYKYDNKNLNHESLPSPLSTKPQYKIKELDDFTLCVSHNKNVMINHCQQYVV